ncbi:MAG: hypothetical protein JST07_01890 [Bacteroidetes bacterium]|nr:hypothetical protein [Bacteroidota bacterium]
MRKKILLIISIALFVGCKKDTPTSNSTVSINGKWTFVSMTDTEISPTNQMSLTFGLNANDYLLIANDTIWTSYLFSNDTTSMVSQGTNSIISITKYVPTNSPSYNTYTDTLKKLNDSMYVKRLGQQNYVFNIYDTVRITKLDAHNLVMYDKIYSKNANATSPNGFISIATYNLKQ